MRGNMKDPFKNIVDKFPKGASFGGVFLFGLGFLALNSYYYGTFMLIQSM